MQQCAFEGAHRVSATSKSTREHEHPSCVGKHPTGRQLHSRPAPGQPSGAQHTVAGNVAGEQTKSFAGDDSVHVHAPPFARNGSSHRVSLAPGPACAQTAAQRDVTQRATPATLAESELFALAIASQLASRFVAHVSIAVTVLVHPSSRQHVSSSVWQRAATQRAQSVSAPPRAQ
jgi:hypothetical protein